MKGKIKSYSRSHGYGFIISDETEEDIFFFGVGSRYKPVIGDKVEFELLKTDQGLRAIKIRSEGSNK